MPPVRGPRSGANSPAIAAPGTPGFCAENQLLSPGCWDSLENFRTKSSAARPAEHGRQTRSHSRRASPAHPG